MMRDREQQVKEWQESQQLRSNRAKKQVNLMMKLSVDEKNVRNQQRQISFERNLSRIQQEEEERKQAVQNRLKLKEDSAGRVLS